MTIQPHTPKGKRLRDARTGARFKYAKTAAKALGLLPATYTSHENGSRDYDDALAARYAEKFGVSAEWLILGDRRSGESDPGFPVIGEIRAGAWFEAEHEQAVLEYLPIIKDPRFASHEQFALRVFGASMNRFAPEGSFVIVADWVNRSLDGLRNNDPVVARRERSMTYQYTLKRARLNKGVWELWPDSNDSKHQEAIPMGTDATVTVFGKVIGRYERV